MDEDRSSSRGGEGLALVLSGGGARAAYQVGLLRCIAQHYPDLHVPILTGVSAGAINAACLAAHPGTFGEAVDQLSDLWWNLDVEEVFRVDPASLLHHLATWSWRLVSGGGPFAPEVRGLVDTTPLRRLLEENLDPAPDGEIVGVGRNIAAGHLRSLAIQTTSYTTGQSMIWVQGRQLHGWERPQRRSRETCITIDHVMASAALPLFFPAIEIEGMWHGDGGIRLTTPLSPAIHTGADRILAVSTRYRRSAAEADVPTSAGYPPPLQIAGQLLNAIFLDMLDQDALRVERTNQLLAALPPERRDQMRVVDVAVIRPSQDLGALAAQCEPRLPKGFRYLLRGLGSRETASPDLLALLMFQGDYCRRLIEIGEADAEARKEEIAALIGRG